MKINFIGYVRNGKYKDCYKLKSIREVPDYQRYLSQQFKEYPDMMTTQQLRQLTGHSTAVITFWSKDKKVRFIFQGAMYRIQKHNLTDGHRYETLGILDNGIALIPHLAPWMAAKRWTVFVK